MRKEGEEDIGKPAQKIREFYKRLFWLLAISSCLCVVECGHDWMWLMGGYVQKRGQSIPGGQRMGY